MTGRRVSAIVLAGGRSSRFGRDKLAEPMDGRTLLQRAIGAVGPFARETIVVLPPAGAPGQAGSPGLMEPPVLPSGVRVVHDPVPFEGPLVGLLAGLGAAKETSVLVIGGDMPELVPAVVQILLAALVDPATDASLLGQEGRPRPLPLALRRDPARAAARRLVAKGVRRLGALPDALATIVIDEAAWRALDPDGRTLRDIDTPADLREAHEDPRRRRSGGHRVLEGGTRD